MEPDKYRAIPDCFDYDTYYLFDTNMTMCVGGPYTEAEAREQLEILNKSNESKN